MYCTLLIIFIMKHTFALKIGKSVKSIHVRIVSIISNLCYCLNYIEMILLRSTFTNRSLNNMYMIPTHIYSIHYFLSILSSNIYCYCYCYCYYSDCHYYYCDRVQKPLLLFLPYIPVMSNHYIIYNPIQQTIIIPIVHPRVTIMCVQSVYSYTYLYVIDTHIMLRNKLLTYNKIERVVILLLQFLININFENIYCHLNNNFHFNVFYVVLKIVSPHVNCMSRFPSRFSICVVVEYICFPLSNRRTLILLFIFKLFINSMRHLSNPQIAINMCKCYSRHVYRSIYLSMFIFIYVYCIIMFVYIPCIFYKRNSATTHSLKILYNTCFRTYYFSFINISFCQKKLYNFVRNTDFKCKVANC